MKSKKRIEAIDVANYFLIICDYESDDFISHLKLQKLVYYAQGFHLAMYSKPLFNEPILAWEHGPVIESLYHKFKGYGSRGIDKPEDFDESIFEQKHKLLLNEIFIVYGQYSAWKLRELTHNEPPWKDTSKNSKISTSKMKAYFKTQLK